ncbi:molybdopterin-dependent oxidoreductase [Chloroflexota bacterium]
MSIKGEEKIVRTVCPLSDAGGCGLSAQVKDNVIVKVSPADFPHAADRGACAKGLATPELVYHKDRLQYPLKRVGERGQDKWQRVSWEEALDSISAKIKELSDKFGSTSVSWSSPDLPSLTGGGYSRLASLTGSSWVSWWGLGDSANPCADIATYGWLIGQIYLTPVDDPKLTIVWGANPALTDYRSMQKVIQSRNSGGKAVAIDPIYTATAQRCDEHIPIRPGTDTALALGMIHVILKEGLQDGRFIIENTVGPLLVRNDNGMFLREHDIIGEGDQQRYLVFDTKSGKPHPCDTPGVVPALSGGFSVSGIECKTAYQLLADMVVEYTPEMVSQITDVPADAVRRLAIGYATEKPASIIRGWGLQRCFYGDLTSRSINTLAAITGNTYLQRPPGFVSNWRSFLTPAEQPAQIPVLMLFDAITKGDPFPIKAMWISGRNPLNQMPNVNRVLKDIFPLLELIVVCDFFMTATARYADYVLPVSTFYECLDLRTTTASHTYLQLQQKIIEPLYESKPDFQIAAEIGRRLGFGEYFNKTEEQYLEEVLASGHPTMEGISLDSLREGPAAAKPLDRPQGLRTPTGRIEFYVERLRPFGQELPVYIESLESSRGDRGKVYPLTLLSTHHHNRIHSSLAKIPGLLRRDPEPSIEINPDDARARGIGDVDVVRVFNDRGQVKLKAKLSEHIKSGVVNICQGWWPDQYIEGHHNQLTHETINEAQQAIMEPNSALYDVLVEVEKAI